MPGDAPTTQARVLEALGSARNYNAWLAEQALPWLGADAIEVGSGIGTFSQLWLDRGVARLTVSEIDDNGLTELHRRFDDDARVEVVRLDLTDAPERAHTGLVALNVLEHIEDDVGALRGAARLVRPGGHVVVLVPAFEFAMSRFDREIGHHRRYRTASLRAGLADAGLEPLDVRYLNAPGLVAWTVGMKWLRLTPGEGPVLRLWDSAVVPVTRAVERRLSPPFGQSVLGVAHVSP